MTYLLDKPFEIVHKPQCFNLGTLTTYQKQLNAKDAQGEEQIMNFPRRGGEFIDSKQRHSGVIFKQQKAFGSCVAEYRQTYKGKEGFSLPTCSHCNRVLKTKIIRTWIEGGKKTVHWSEDAFQDRRYRQSMKSVRLTISL